ncbi:MAG: DUF327 family protein [Firmicutes bacterium]|nr:DUF327 family protein [Bacillota bacterium]
MRIDATGPARVREEDGVLPAPGRARTPVRDLTASPAWRRLLQLEAELVAVPGPDTVQRYRQHVRTLLNRLLERATAARLPPLSARGRFQQLFVVARIDWELAEIGRQALTAHPGTALLGHLDALKGLLVDLWV